ncbi:hypothetical protein [Ideonella livida]|uniref:PsiF repeat-containing protein n=1 Tax=Ideonella livida TaxID=2707176 RepID=A0A7C9TME9_9BURK|nr:hypothetical protein [Ideonella livida]NDY93164.1 hypothetical protein [Ideonella livida]
MHKFLTLAALAAFTLGAQAQPASAPAGKTGEKPHKCVAEAQAKGLSGDAAKEAIKACREEKKVKVAEHAKKKEACEAEVKGQGLKDKEALAAFKACMKKD